MTDSVRGSAVEYVRDVHPDGGEGLLAIVVRTGQSSGPGCQFVTEPRHPLQVAVMRHERGHVVPPHIHLERLRTYTLTQEVLTVLAGVYRVTVYTSAGRKVQDIILAPGDAVVLLAGGHSVRAVTDGELLEIKTGPYRGRAADKQDLDVGGA